MIESELIELVDNIQKHHAEFQNVEVKSAHLGCPKKLYDTISAFSNQDSGGIIVFGINEEERFNITGVYDVQALQKGISQQCNQMSPIVRPVFTVTTIKNCSVVSAEIPSVTISQRPCYYAGVGRLKGSYIRVGDFDEHMSEYEIYSYEAFRKKYQDELLCCERVKENDMNLHAIENYIQLIEDDKPNFKTNFTFERKQELLQLLRENQYTLVSVLLFSYYPQVFYPQYSILATHVQGTSIENTFDKDRFIDNKRISGTIPEMVHDTVSFVKRNMKNATRIDEADMKHKVVNEYPIIAIREAILNALIHRDYSFHTQGMPITLTMFNDRIEIRNPGGLYGRLSIDTLGKVIPDTRNPILANILETLHITENRYSGIPTIFKEAKSAGLPLPIFEDLRSEFKFTLYNQEKYNNFINPSEIYDEENEAILRFCQNPRSREEIAKFLQVTCSPYMVRTIIMPLIEKNLLHMTLPNTPRSKFQKYYSI